LSSLVDAFDTLLTEHRKTFAIMSSTIEVMAGPYHALPLVQHWSPVPGTAQTCVIAGFPLDFLRSNFFPYLHTWRWKTIDTATRTQAGPKFCLINKPLHPRCARPKFCLINKPLRPRSAVPVQALVRTSSEDEASVRNYFQVDELEKEGDHDEDAATEPDDDPAIDCGNEDFAETVNASDAKSVTAQQLCDGVAWAEKQEPVEQFMLHYEHAMARRLSRPEPAWVKKRGGRVRHAAYLLGMRLPEFKPSSEFGVDVLRASSPMMPPAQPLLSKPIAKPTLVPEKPTNAETVDAADWEFLDDMSLPEMEQHIQRNETARLPSAALQDCSDCKPTLKPVEVPLEARIHYGDDWKPVQVKKKTQPKNSVSNSESVKANATNTSAVEQKTQPKKLTAEQAAVKVFKGQIKARKLPMKYGFIEVCAAHREALRAHPLWTRDVAVDVFWHSKDCNYLGQRAGDIVKFTVSLMVDKNGKVLQCFQAKNVALVRGG